MRKLGLIVATIVIVLGIDALVHQHNSRNAGSAAWIADREPVTPLAPGPPLATEPSLTDLTGMSFSMASLRGKVVVVNFWAAWCTPCAEEIPKFVGLQQRYQGQGLQMIGISMDDVDSELRDFYRRYEMNYPVVAGSQKVAEEYGGILGLPTTFIIDRDGHIQKKLTGSTDFAALEQEVVAQLAKNGG